MGFSIWLLLFLILDLLVVPTLAQACSRLDFCWTCSNTGSYTNGSVYEQNLNSLLSSFSSSPTQNQADSGFYNSSLGQGSNKVNAIALCRGDLGLQACRSCLKNNTVYLLQTCLYQREATLWAPHCMVRYSDNLIFGIEKDDPSVYVPSQNNVSNAQEYERVLNPVLQYLSDKAASGDSVKKYAAGHATVPGREMIYALVQCTPDLDNQNCSNCLKKAMSDILGHIGAKQGGRVLKPSCTLRYEAGRFYEATSDSIVNVSTPVTPTTPVTPPSVPSKQGRKSNTKKTIIIIIIVVVIAFVTMLFTGICIFSRVKQQRGKLESRLYMCTFVSLLLRFKQFFIQVVSFSDEYDFEIIRSATDDFSDANKLGQGGFGAVYKGDREFKNEVMLLTQLQHRNLVRLLGFCLTGEERLLIYEYIPNTSLNHFIFDPINHGHLDWETRYKIIGGIVRGLLYLHEDSRLRIIHRDLKPSNILLGEDMNPKIADFGTAKLFVMDQTQGDTKIIVGTYGYMAPEYAIHGRFSVKSDVFSFGVLVLEMVSGKKIGSFRNGENDEDLLSYAWRNWKSDTIPNIIDPMLTIGSRNEMIRCIHIGLLCVQENVNDRPIMASVVSMLNSDSLTLSVPSKPAYYSHYNTDSDTSRSAKSSVYVSRNQVSNITEPYPR
ncbi:cysteine-rich receptor-like protein kinase 26 [Rosa sericea]